MAHSLISTEGLEKNHKWNYIKLKGITPEILSRVRRTTERKKAFANPTKN